MSDPQTQGVVVVMVGVVEVVMVVVVVVSRCCEIFCKWDKIIQNTYFVFWSLACLGDIEAHV